MPLENYINGGKLNLLLTRQKSCSDTDSMLYVSRTVEAQGIRISSFS